MAQFYMVLGVAADADKAQVKAAFRSLAKTCHPDLKGGSEQRFREINSAYKTLVDPMRRAAYDAESALMRARARRRLKGALATMTASFTLTLGSGMFVAGWLLGA